MPSPVAEAQMAEWGPGERRDSDRKAARRCAGPQTACRSTCRSSRPSLLGPCGVRVLARYLDRREVSAEATAKAEGPGKDESRGGDRYG